MALRFRNRVSQVTSTSGTTLSVTLGAVRDTYFAFYKTGDPEDTDTLVEGDTFGYLMQSVSNRAILEIGIGTMTSPTTFTRGGLETSSNNGALVDFPTGTSHVSLIMTAAQMAEASRALVLGDLPPINFSNLIGSAAVGQIPDLPASKITSGTLDIARIPDVPSSKVTGNFAASRIDNGVFDLARIPDLPSSKITGNFNASRIDAGVFDAARIPALPYLTGPLAFADLTGQATLAQLPATIPLTQIGAISFTDVGGTATAAQIPNLDAAKIVTGVFADSLIPSLAASKTTSGTFDEARIPSLTTSKIISGIFTGARGGLGADASAFAGLIKMAAGVASVATADTDYVTPSGSGTLANKIFTTPTIASFVNATHNHQNNAGGGQLNASNVFSAGQIPLARGGTNADLSATGGTTSFLRQASTGAAVTVGGIASADLTTALATPPPYGATTPNTIAGTTGTFSGNLVVDTNTLFVDAAADKVGIGASPTYKLDVQGTSGTVGIRAASNTAGDILFYGTGTVTGSINLISTALNATGTVLVNVANVNNSSLSANASFRLATNSANGGDPRMNFSIVGAQDWSFGVDNSDSDKFKIAATSLLDSSTYMTIDTNGNVGIGTQSPGAALHINVSADRIQEIVRGHSTQTANLTEWQTSGTTRVASVDNAGVGRFTGLRIDAAPTAAVVSQTHHVAVNINGTTYKLLLAS